MPFLDDFEDWYVRHTISAVLELDDGREGDAVDADVYVRQGPAKSRCWKVHSTHQFIVLNYDAPLYIAHHHMVHHFIIHHYT